MAYRRSDAPSLGPVLDMTPDGQFRASATVAPGALKLGGVAILIAAVSGALALAALALWLAFMLIPVAIAAGVIGWGAIKLQRWQAKRAGPVDLYRH